MVRFFRRRYPSANSVLLPGPAPVLVDTGFGTDADELLHWLGGTAPALIVNTHAHSDHAGGNGAVQERCGAPVAAGAAEMAVADRGEAAWLAQPIAPYRVARTLAEGDAIETGAERGAGSWRVVATPGHTPGHLSLFCAATGEAVLGDALHGADVGWICPFRHRGALEAAARSVERVAALGARVGYSGHGAAITDMAAAVARARRRIAAWRARPEEIGWHACKRIFAHMLMLHDGVAEADLLPALLACPWFVAHAEQGFGTTPEAFLKLLLEEMIRADAAWWRDGRLVARADYRFQGSPA